MASINKLKVGQILYKTYRTEMGNTMMKTICIHSYKVVEIDLESKKVILAGPYVGGSNSRSIDEQKLKPFKVRKPELKESFTGAIYNGDN